MNQKEYEALPAQVPMTADVTLLSGIFKNRGRSLFAVGGVVRDYLYCVYHGSLANFKPKDIDLATEARPEEVMDILTSPAAKRAGVTVFPKGLSFGVISAMLDGREYEIATFREEWYDPDAGDGRRPDKVEYSTPQKDAGRRDLTINALFYDIDAGEVRDYNLDENGNGTGIADLKKKAVRPVGNARDRFREDRLRVLRLVRFFSRFNGGSVLDHMDKETLDAVAEFKSLPGVSGERIAAEFTAGLKQCVDPVMFLRNYENLGLFPATFPGVQIGTFEKVGSVKNPHAVIAWLLKDNGPARAKVGLNRSKYTGTVFDAVEFLLNLYEFNPEKVIQLLRRRDLYKQEENAKAALEKGLAMTKDVEDFAKIAGIENEMRKFLAYKPQVKSEDFMHLEPSKRLKAMAAAEAAIYQK